MMAVAERVYFRLCLAFGRMLRAGRYSQVRITNRDGEVEVRKQRRFYAPLLVWLGDPLVRVLDTGGRVLPQREWEQREQLIYRTLHGSSIRLDADEALVLPYLPGETLADLLESPDLDDAMRSRAIELAVLALAQFHRTGFTHGDAMAENVMVDLAAGVARWFDFETVHGENRPLAWRRADDVRALLMTCLLRTAAEKQAATLDLILDVYADGDVTRLLATSFRSIFRRPLTFHLGQAPLSLEQYQAVAHLLRIREQRA